MGKNEQAAVAAESTAAPAAEPKPNTRKMGGMVELRWANIPIWECPRCRATTFDKAEAKVHVCKKIRPADEEPLK